MLGDVPEASGLAVSRRHEGLLWTHNDSGNTPVLFAIDESGDIRGRVRVPANMRDWEAIAAAPCKSGDCLYLGDIGDNAFARRQVQVLVVPEPDLTDARTMPPDTYTVNYPDGRHNAEAMFIAGGRLFIVTRDRGTLYGSAAPLGENHSIALQRIAPLGLKDAVVTDAEASPDEGSVAVRTSHEVLIYRTADLIRGDIDALVRIPIDGLGEAQGEGVALGALSGDTPQRRFTVWMLYLASEGRPWSRAGRFISLRCSLPSPP